MDSETLVGRIVDEFDAMAPQVQAAARFVLDYPEDVAMLSMREQARRAGVPPVTMIRLARRVGFAGYEDFRGVFAAALRQPSRRFSDRAGALQARQKRGGDEGLLDQVTGILAAEVNGLVPRNKAANWLAAARTLEDARRVYCLGLRSCYPVAFHFHYIFGLFRDNAVLLDGAGDTGMDLLRSIGRDDAMLAVSVAPYAAAALEMARFGTRKGAALVAITDSRVAPLAKLARQTLLVPTATPSFFHAITPAFAAAETLAALIAARGGAQALTTLRNSEEQFAAFNTYWPPRRTKTRKSDS
ncbi:MAG: MurR/RpiR family transcriptional regulator [Alphaproteobacteria bacterium]|nr:MurR/RpiR family transcriptional regulator [Alphaproteobacteria bacterium]